MKKKEINEEFLRLGFHHSWGMWIFNKDSNFRIVVRKTKKKNIIISLTNKACYFDYEFKVSCKSDIENIIFEYYNFKQKFPNIETNTRMKHLPIPCKCCWN